jgi:hypothetical protein
VNVHNQNSLFFQHKQTSVPGFPLARSRRHVCLLYLIVGDGKSCTWPDETLFLVLAHLMVEVYSSDTDCQAPIVEDSGVQRAASIQKGPARCRWDLLAAASLTRTDHATRAAIRELISPTRQIERDKYWQNGTGAGQTQKKAGFMSHMECAANDSRPDAPELAIPLI